MYCVIIYILFCILIDYSLFFSHSIDKCLFCYSFKKHFLVFFFFLRILFIIQVLYTQQLICEHIQAWSSIPNSSGTSSTAPHTPVWDQPKRNEAQGYCFENKELQLNKSFCIKKRAQGPNS